MGTYLVTIDLPVMIRVTAPDEETAEEAGDKIFADVYEQIEREVISKLPTSDVWLGQRYDDTDVNEEDEI